MKKEIWLDMDGTIADLYGVDGWLDMLLNENARPYEIAKPLVNMRELARVLNRLIEKGWEIGVISWLAKNGTNDYNKKVANAKMKWLARHLKSVKFAKIDIVEYGTPKQINRNGILFDDEKQNRESWLGVVYNVDNIIQVLKELEK